MTEELWEKLGHSHDEQLAYYPWPQYEEAKCVESHGGDRRAGERQGEGPPEGGCRHRHAAAAIAAAKAEPAVAAALAGKTRSPRRSTSRAVWSTWP